MVKKVVKIQPFRKNYNATPVLSSNVNVKPLFKSLNKVRL